MDALRTSNPKPPPPWFLFQIQSFYPFFFNIKTMLPNTLIRNFSVTPSCLRPTLLLSQLKKNKNPFQTHAQGLKLGLCLNTFVLNSLLSAYANLGCLESSIKLFDEIPHRDTISWTAAINGYVKNDFPKRGLDCFIRMRSSGVRIDEVTVVGVLHAAGMLRDIRFGRSVHGFYVETRRVCSDVYLGAALIDMYAKCGLCDDAWKVSNQMLERNTVSWSALIAGYVHCSRFNEALLLLEEMLVEQVEPNQATLSTVLTACAQLGALAQGRWIHRYIEKNKLGINLILGTSLIDMYAKCGCIQESFTVFQNLSDKNVYSWTTMINGLAMHGHALSSLTLFSRMLMDGIEPNQVTFLAVLCACCHAGLVDEGRGYFSSMTQIYGIEANVNHYGCLVDLLGRAGHLDEALSVIQSMPMEPSPGIWGALLNSCVIHRNYELGEEVGEYLIRLQPDHCGRYMLLANIYSMRQKWEDMACIRKLMKARGLEKSQGCSLIEVNGTIHEFATWEILHNESKDIYEMVDGINLQLELLGYETKKYLLALDEVAYGSTNCLLETL